VLREVTHKCALWTPHAVTERELSEPPLHSAGQYRGRTRPRPLGGPDDGQL